MGDTLWIKIISIIGTWVLLILDIILILDMYILFRQKKRFILWNFGKALSDREINGVVNLMKQKIHEMKPKVMVISYGAKWQVYVFEVFTIIQGILHSKSKDGFNKYWSIINNDGVGGAHNYRYRLITLHEFNLRLDNDLEKKKWLLGI